MESVDRVTLSPFDGFGHGFVDSRHLAPGEDENRLRFTQVPQDGYRQLTEEEIQRLKANGNSAADWSEILVKDPFDPATVRRNSFSGLVRLGPFVRQLVGFHDFFVEVGVTDSRLVSCDILSNAAVHNCPYISHYIIGEECIVYRVGELQTTDHSKFGVGIVKEGEDEDVRVTIDVMNEAGGREILPFVGMNSADAWLWAKHRGRPVLMERLKAFTEATATAKRGLYGTVGRHSVIKSCHIIKDVAFGEACYVKGCNKLKNLTVDSSQEEPTQLGEGIELVNGIVGRGSRVFYGSKAIRFVMGTHCSLKYGARLIHSYLGDNSTISCCEVLNNLIFPFHEEHHNNSFLIASLVMGQSNMAAGATIGSNHNSRKNDGELVAGRGFWPALATSVKHDSRFSSFVLLSKGDYPYELDIRMPFSLLSDRGQRQLIPAYWWMYNLYALARNAWKFSVRDKRRDRSVAIVTDFLAPDTAGEIIKAIDLLEYWSGVAILGRGADRDEAARQGREALKAGIKVPVIAYDMENSRLGVRILKASEGWTSYHEMLLFYGMKTVSDWARERGESFSQVLKTHPDAVLEDYVNLGGQLTPKHRLEELMDDIEQRKVRSWDEVHACYTQLASLYAEDRLNNAIAVLEWLAHRRGRKIEDLYGEWDRKCIGLSGYIHDQALSSRKKDYESPFRHLTYDDEAERLAVLGKEPDEVPFPLPCYIGVSWA